MIQVKRYDAAVWVGQFALGVCLSACWADTGALLDRRCVQDQDCGPKQQCLRGYCGFLCIETGPEICDGVDNDCDARIDEDSLASCDLRDQAYAHACNDGVCVYSCEPGWGDADQNLHEQGSNGCECSIRRESCNYVDDNCDGVVDNVFGLGQPCEPATWRASCDEGGLMCNAFSHTTTCDRKQVVELCGNGIDDDCQENATSPHVQLIGTPSNDENQLSPRLITATNHALWAVWSAGKRCGVVDEDHLIPLAPKCETIRWQALQGPELDKEQHERNLSHVMFDAMGHINGMDLIWQPELESPTLLRRIIAHEDDVLVDGLPYTRARLATARNGSRAILSGVSTSNVGELVVHEVLFALDNTNDFGGFVGPVIESRPVWSWSTNSPHRDIRPSSVALNDEGDRWLVAWISRDRLYWKLEGSSEVQTLSQTEYTDALITHTPEVAYLGDDSESSWVIAYTQSYRRTSSSGSELTTTTAHILLGRMGEQLQGNEINANASSTYGTQYLFPQIARTHEGPVIVTMRDRNPINNVPLGLRAYRPENLDRVSRLPSPHPLRAPSEELLRVFFPFAQKRPFDIHGFRPTHISTDAPHLYAVWSYSKSNSRRRLMGSLLTLHPTRRVLGTSCLP